MTRNQPQIERSATALTLDEFAHADRPKVSGPPPQCVTCSKFVAVNAEGTRRYVERGDYGTVYSVEFECARCAKP